MTELTLIFLLGVYMGTPLPPNKPGNLCSYCWGIGKKFGDTQTPYVLRVQLFDLQPGEFWDPDQEMLLYTPKLLEQTGDPCIFNIHDGAFAWTWYFTATVTAAVVKHVATDTDVFRSAVGQECQLSFSSDIIQPLGEFAMFGSILATWNPEDLK